MWSSGVSGPGQRWDESVPGAYRGVEAARRCAVSHQGVTAHAPARGVVSGQSALRVVPGARDREAGHHQGSHRAAERRWGRSADQ